MSAGWRAEVQSSGALAAALVAAAATLLSGCNLNISLKAEARDQWTRQYTLAAGGTLDLRNSNGLIQVETVDGDRVDITAERVVQAATDQAAKDALAAFEIQESASSDRIALDASNRGPNLSNINRRVDFHVRLPRGSHVRLVTTNGNIEVTGPLTGAFQAETTNGQVEATGLENNARASTTNGSVSLQLDRIGPDGVTCETTNGRIAVGLPPSANARLSARVTNGAIHTEGLSLNVSEQSRRRLEATLGSGGPPIDLETTNGAIEVRPKAN
jgi:hypothetical protein